MPEPTPVPPAEPPSSGSNDQPDLAARYLAMLQAAPQAGEPLGVRARTEHMLLKHLAFADIAVALQNTKVTRFNDRGEFETLEHATCMALPDGSRVNKLEDVAYWCCKFRKKKQLSYCGPMTKERANFCARCNRVLCAHHSWQFLFSTKKHCAWCLLVRCIEVSLGLVWLVVKVFVAIVIVIWRAWFRAYR
ncbi:MAG: hypothetical protein BroJett014_03850 [Planctomycetota bacterium]|nr:hypothetical protein [Planctomycetota bacterium]GIK51412.1 MAG: hypothetical protein BroJett014_03850 [Planctomycetota bacterium]